MTHRILLISTSILIILLAAIAFFVPIDSKEYMVLCKGWDIQTRYNIFHRKEYDAARTEYIGVVDCMVPQKGKIRLYVL